MALNKFFICINNYFVKNRLNIYKPQLITHMKKIFAIISIFWFFLNNLCYAQASAEPSAVDTANSQQNSKKNKWQERYDKASPEQKAKMENRREIMKKLTPEQKELVKKEQQRHREEMKKITGHDIINHENE